MLGGGVQVIPNSREVYQKIQSLLPAKRYMHYFRVNLDFTQGTVFRVAAGFAIPSTDAPSRIASNSYSIIVSKLLDTDIPCSGCAQLGSDVIILSSVHVEFGGDRYCFVYTGSKISGSSTTLVTDIKSVSTGMSAEWLQSIEI